MKISRLEQKMDTYSDRNDRFACGVATFDEDDDSDDDDDDDVKLFSCDVEWVSGNTIGISP